ncbi:MAG: myo-inositol 2-dehydrogenase/D-chiro-inositol 1-dehydrogenase [Verrucomicrobiales bacterium]|jgi:myo-inositol 2-dehydrogenase/D-chiro-inositol 1-dehydrogenase
MSQTTENPSVSTAQPAAENLKGRRGFLKTGAAAAAGVSLAALPVESYAQVAGSDKLKVGIVGTGGRGSKAVIQTLNANDGAVLSAAGDVFEERLMGTFAKRKAGGLGQILGQIEKNDNLKNQIDLPKDRQFVGFDAYQNVIDSSDVVVLTTPPGFRPMMFEAAINAGKHVFMEKPVCTDAKGYNRVIKAAKMADEKGLKVVVGLQRHYQDKYLQAFAKVHEEGLIGDIISAQCWWNGGRPWTVARDPEWSELTYQMHNWYHFDWVCGDHIAEQHVHNIDIVNWFVSGDSANGGHPVKAQGMGGRTGWEPKTTGNIFDHHYVEFKYDNGVVMNSQCRHIKGTFRKVDEEIHGSKGILYMGQGKITDRNGKTLWQHRTDREGGTDPYQVEHNKLHAAIKNDTPLNNAYYGAHSSFTSCLGRLATYHGQEITWDEATGSDFELVPDGMTWDTPAPVQPVNDKLEYDSAMPGTTKLPWQKKA